MASKKKLIVISEETEKLLKEASLKEHRTMNNMIEHIILNFFENKEGYSVNM